MFIILVAFASVKVAFYSVTLAFFSRASGLIETEYTDLLLSIVTHCVPLLLYQEIRVRLKPRAAAVLRAEYTQVKF